MPSDVLITPASSKIDFTDGANATKRLNISGTAFSFNSNLNVLSSTSLSSAFKAEGVNGTLFEVTDDLSNSLLSVNTIGGLPVFEVFANNSIIGGQYGANDFVISGNKIGLGYANPVNKLSVSGAVSIGASYNVAAPSNGLIVQGDVGIGVTSFAFSSANRANLEMYGSSESLLALRNSTGNSYIQKSGADFYINNVTNGFIAISNNGSERWRITNAGVFESNNAQTIRTSTGNLTLATNAGNGHIILSPHGTGNVGIGIATPTAVLNVKTSTQPNREVFMGDSAAVSGVFRARLDDNSLSFIQLENRDTASTTNHGVGIRFNLSTNVSNNSIDAGGVYLVKEQQWTATTSTQDSALRFFTTLDGAASEKLRIQSDGNVGIGTTSATAKLEVDGSIYLGGNIRNRWSANIWTVAQFPAASSTSPTYFMGFTTDPVNRIFYISNKNNDGSATNPNGSIIFRTGTTPSDRMLISYTGNVGIGTINPGRTLEVSLSAAGDAGGYLRLRNPNTTINTETGIEFFNTTSTTNTDAGAAIRAIRQSATNTSDLTISTTANSNLTEKLRITSTGNVGIGTTSPVQKLELHSTVGNPYTSGVNQDGIMRFSNTTDNAVFDIGMRSGGAGAWLQSTDKTNLGVNYPLLLNPNGGNVSIGALTASNKLHVNGSVSIGSNYNTAATTNGLIVEGNVGIGITGPTAKLDVEGTNVNGYSLLLRSGDNYNGTDSVQIAFGFANQTNYRHSIRTRHNPLAPIGGVVGNNIDFYVWKRGTDAAANLGSQFVMTMQGDGHVGIGTTNPSARLDVRPTTATEYQGTVPYQTTTAAILSPVMAAASVDTYTSILQLVSVRQALVAGRYAHGYLGFSTVDNSNINGILDAGRISIKNDDGIGSFSATSMGFWTNTGGSASNPATERVRIASDGNVGIGTLSPAYKLDVNSSIVSRSTLSSPRFSNAGTYVYGVTNSPTWNQSCGSAVNNNATAPDGTTSAGTYTLTSTCGSYDLFQTISGLTNGRVYTIGMWVKLGTATNFCLVVNNTGAWNTIGGKAFTSSDGLSTSKWTHISFTFAATATGAINLHLGYHAETAVTQQTAGTVFLWNIEMTEFSSTWIGNVEDEIRLPGSSIWTSRGNVGIGTVTPTGTYSKLAVAGGIRTLDDNNSKLELGRYSSGASNSYIKLGSNSNSLRITNNTDAADIFTIENNGNVGIGTTIPTAKLDVLGVRLGRDFSIANRATVRLDANGAGFPSDILFGHTAAANQDSWNGVYWSLSSRATANSNRFYFYRGTGNPAPNNSEAVIMSFDPNLNVGVGFEAPANRLSIAGSVSIGSGYNTAAPTNGLIVEGTVGIGVSTLNAGAKLHVVGNADIGDSAADTGIIVRHGAGSAQYGRIRFYDSNGLNVNTIHSFPVAWQGGTLLNSSAGAVNITGWNGVTFGSWNNVDVAFASNGTNYFKNNVGIGITSPSARLHLNSTTSGATLLRADGTNGTLFSVVDDLSDSLMSVNNSAGLPVLEVFADDRVVAGQYGANDFVLINNKLGLGTNSPAYKLDVRGSTVNARVGIMEFGAWPLDTTYIYLQNNSLSLIGANYGFLQGPTGETFVNAASGQTLHFRTGNTERWAITSGGILQSDGAQTIRTSTNALTLATNGGNGHIILSPNGTGNVGIGTTSPAAKLDIVGTNTTIALSFGTTVPNNPLFINTYGSNTGIGMDQATAGLRLVGDYSGGSNPLVDIGYYSGGTVAHANWISRLKVLNNGNVGIGTTTPAALLQIGTGTPTSVTGGIQFGSDVSARLYRTAPGVITCPGTIAATFSGSLTGTASGNLTSSSTLTAGNLSGTIPSAVLGNSSVFIGTTSIALNRGSAALTLSGVNISGTAASETFATVTGRGSSTTTQISVGTTSSGSMYTGIKSGAGYSDTVSGATFKSITDHPTGGSFAFAAYYNGAPGTGTNSFYVAANGGAYFAQGVGIGVTPPLQALHVNGNIILDGVTNGYTQGATRGIGYGSNNGGVSVDGFSGMDIQSVNAPAPNNGNYSQNLRFWTHHYGTGTGGSPRMILQYNGNVGIGSLAPSAKLNVLSSTSLSSVFKTEGVNGTLFEVTDDLSNSLMSVNTIGGLPVFEVFANNSIIAGQYGRNDFVISGNKIGIGTASPVYKLNVYDNSSGNIDEIFIGTIGNDQIAGGRTGGSFGISTKSTSNGNLILTASSAMYLRAGGNTRVFIKNDGNVGVGTETPANKLHVLTTGGAVNAPNVVAIFQANTATTTIAGGGTAIKFVGVSSGGNLQDYDQCMISSLGYADNNRHGMQFWIKPNASTVLTAALTINNDSSVVANSSITAASFSGPLTGSVTGTATNATQLGGVAASSYVRNDVDATDSTALFRLKTVTKSLTVTAGWTDTGISGGSDLESGAYILTLNVDNYAAPASGGQYNETYTGIMYWYAGATNSADYDEIPLHKSGHAPNGRYINLRTLRGVSGVLKLQITCNLATGGASNYIFKFRRMI